MFLALIDVAGKGTGDFEEPSPGRSPNQLLFVCFHYNENKGKYKYTEKSGIHKTTTVHRKFGLKDVAEHFNLTIGQARRIIYVKKS